MDRYAEGRHDKGSREGPPIYPCEMALIVNGG